MVYLGTIINTHGVKGELVLDDIPKGISKINLESKVNIGFSEKFSKNYKLKSWRKVNSKVIFSVYEFTNKESAEINKEMALFTEEEEINLKENSKFNGIMQGYKVIDEANSLIGIISDVLYLPANDVIMIDTEKGELPFPVTEQTVKSVNHKTKEIIVSPPNGIFELLD